MFESMHVMMLGVAFGVAVLVLYVWFGSDK
jgi:hypothetical protein